MELPSSEPTSPHAQRAVEELFDAVRVVDPILRDALIDSATDDPWIRAEVRSLLVFDVDATPTFDDASRPAVGFDPSALIGVQVDGFTIRSVIGSGGMGAVFAADQHSPSRRVALKVLATSTTRASILARFQRESQILARLDHPSIARVIAAGTLTSPAHDEVRPYFVMELVEDGRAITSWAKDSRPSLAQLVETFTVACDAVGSGHRRGIVHLDLKPSNLLVGGDARLHVIDYGIAKSLDAIDGLSDANARSEPLTIDARLIGTPQYMSPEQFAADPSRIDSRSDVYSLGLILYELLTQQLPYSTRGHSLVSMARIVAESPPIQPLQLNSTLPSGLNAIVLKALEKNPDERYGTASELADELRRWLHDEPILATAPSTFDLIGRLIRKNRVATAAIAAGTLAIVTATAASVIFAMHASREAERAIAQTARGNIRAASTSLALGEPADALMSLAQAPPSTRGWETRHLRQRVANFELFTAVGAEIFCFVESPATHELIAGVTGGYVQISDLDRVRPSEVIDLRLFGGLPTTVVSLGVSSDGATILVTNSLGVLIHINRAAGMINAVGNGYSACACLKSLIAGVRHDGSVDFIDLATNTVVSSLPGIGVLTDASFTRDGRVALISFHDGRLRCVDLDSEARTLKERWSTTARAAGTRAVAISPAGSLAVVAWRDGCIARIDPRTGGTLYERDLPGGSVFDVAISPDERTIAASSWTRTVRLVESESLTVRTRLGGTSAHVWGITFSHDSSRLFGRITIEEQNADGSLVLTDFAGAWRLQEIEAILDSDTLHFPACATWDSLSRTFTTADRDGVLREISPVDGSVKVIGRLDVIAGVARSIARRGDEIVVGHGGGATTLLAMNAQGLCQHRWRAEPIGGAITTIAFSPDGTLVAIGDDENQVALLDMSDGATHWRAALPLGLALADRRRVTKPLFLDDGALLTFANVDSLSTRPIFRVSDGEPLTHIATRTPCEADDALVHPDGSISYLGITGSLKRETRDGIETQSLPARNGGVICANSEFTRFFIAARDGSARVVDVDSAEELMRLEAPAGLPLAVAFDETLDALAVIASRGIMRVWRGMPNYSLPPSSHPTAIDLLILQPVNPDPKPLPPPRPMAQAIAIVAPIQGP